MKKQKVTYNGKYIGHIYKQGVMPVYDYYFTKFVMFMIWAIGIVFAGYIFINILGTAVIGLLKVSDDVKCHQIIDEAMEYGHLLSEYDVRVCR